MKLSGKRDQLPLASQNFRYRNLHEILWVEFLQVVFPPKRIRNRPLIQIVTAKMSIGNILQHLTQILTYGEW